MLVVTLLIPLAFSRYFHVDEIQVAYNAALLGVHHQAESMNFLTPFVVPLSWIAGRHAESWPALLEMRAAFLLLFLLNLGLVTAAAHRLRGAAARAGVLVAATLIQPFWRHGFEIRHDNLLLAGSLGLLLVARLACRSSPSPLPLALAGATAVWMQMNSFKAFLYWPAGIAFILLLVGQSSGRPHARRAFGWMAVGAFAGVVSGFALLAAGGIARAYVALLVATVGTAASAASFSSAEQLGELLREVPHLALLASVSVAWSLRAFRRGPDAADRMSLVLSAWLVLQLLALLVNPVPYTYNFVHVYPFLFLAAVDGFEILRAHAGRYGAWMVATAALGLAFAFLLHQGRDRVGRVSAEAQRRHIEAVEAVTGPSDPFLDGAGLVLSRPPTSPHWMLHSLFAEDYRRGRRESFISQLRRDPAPALLTNYRWGWLTRDDLQLIRDRYVAIGPRMLLLGGRSQDESGRFEIVRRGRYRVESIPEGRALELDGATRNPPVAIELDLGSHAWSGAAVRWIWVGPGLDEPLHPGPPLPGGDLFVSD